MKKIDTQTKRLVLSCEKCTFHNPNGYGEWECPVIESAWSREMGSHADPKIANDCKWYLNVSPKPVFSCVYGKNSGWLDEMEDIDSAKTVIATIDDAVKTIEAQIDVLNAITFSKKHPLIEDRLKKAWQELESKI